MHTNAMHIEKAFHRSFVKKLLVLINSHNKSNSVSKISSFMFSFKGHFYDILLRNFFLQGGGCHLMVMLNGGNYC